MKALMVFYKQLAEESAVNYKRKTPNCRFNFGNSLCEMLCHNQVRNVTDWEIMEYIFNSFNPVCRNFYMLIDYNLSNLFLLVESKEHRVPNYQPNNLRKIWKHRCEDFLVISKLHFRPENSNNACFLLSSSVYIKHFWFKNFNKKTVHLIMLTGKFELIVLELSEKMVWQNYLI